jgi:hypothetical protein
MYNTHWIDGYFDGGHYYSEYPEWEFTHTFYDPITSPNTLGLSSSQPHGLVIGDKLIIDKTDKSINPQYDGSANVVKILNDYSLIVDRVFGLPITGTESGTTKRKTGTGVIQNFVFDDNNVSNKVLDSTTTNLLEVYTYNSWVDVKYLTQSASNLLREQIVIGQVPFNNEAAELNLYGYVTNDVLSSDSVFRNSWSLDKSKYSLGTKYKIYEDFLGEISEFNEPFSDTSMDNFYNNGWLLSNTASYLITRTADEKLKISRNSQSITMLSNSNITIDKKRYSLIEFDLEYNSSSDLYNGGKPFIYFGNELLVGNGSKFPISDYVYHTRTQDVKKYEYFYNRRALDMFLLNETGFTASFDNIKFYEVDMIPFFQYTTEEYINKAVQVPFQGIAPPIDYDDTGIAFISNIDIRLDSLSTQKTQGDIVPSSSGGGLINKPKGIN